MSRKEPTIATILYTLSDEIAQPISERDLFHAVLTRRPSKAKQPFASIREQLRSDAARLGWVLLGDGQVMPLRVALNGLRFRVPLPADTVEQEAVAMAAFRPFITASIAPETVQFVDAAHQPIPTRIGSMPQGEGLFGDVTAPAFLLDGWLASHHARPGDSLLVTVIETAPLTLMLEHEPASAFAAPAVAAQDAALRDALVRRVAASTAPLTLEDAILPIFAVAPWRTAYPGQPWQQVIASEPRLRVLADDAFVLSSYRHPASRLLEYVNSDDDAMLAAIAMLQRDLRQSRRAAAERGLWNGVAPRISTSRIVFDVHQGIAETIYPGEIDALDDHTADIEERLAHGMYANAHWNEDDVYLEDGPDLDTSDMDLESIDDMDEFMSQHPDLTDATRRLMHSLSEEEIRRLHQAENDEDIQDVLTQHLANLLRTDPSLFVPLDMDMIGQYDETQSAAPRGYPDPHLHDVPFSDLFSDRSLERQGQVYDSSETDYSFELYEDDEQDDEDEDDDEQLQVELAFEQSTVLMNRFYHDQIDRGKSEGTVANRTRDLWIYADFLANYYGRSLEMGDYATLDECLFFYFPRKVTNSSPRWAREICTSLKQFYTWMKQQEVRRDDGFAVGIWQRRDQVARVVELYQQIDADSEQYNRLFAHLFAPYTV